MTAVAAHGRRVVAALDRQARAIGIHAGMTITRARAFAPDLQVAPADLENDLAALHRLALWAGRRYSPVVAPDPPDGLWLDITGCSALFGSERALLKDLHRRLMASGLHVQIAVADTAGAAHAVARQVPAGRPVTIPPGEHRKAIALLPVSCLRLPPQTVEALRKLGFERVEQLMAAPRGPMAKRFGRMLYQRLDQALGHVREALVPVFPDEVPHAKRDLLEPIVTAGAMELVIRDLTNDVVGQLLRSGAGARRLDCYFHRVDGHCQAIRVGTAAPSREAAHLAKLLTAKVETVDPGLGIEAMTLVAPLVEAMAARQTACLEQPDKSGPDVAALIDALANRFGQRRLYRTTPSPSVMPERTVALTPPLAKPADKQWDQDLPRPSRMLHPPERIDVIAMLPDSPPAQFVWRGKRHRVAQADGPERLHGEWWRERGAETETPLSVRDYFQVETTSGGRYWLFRLGDGENASTGPMHWYLHGAFA